MKKRIVLFSIASLMTISGCDGFTSHNWSSTWSGDDTYHWKECTDEGCSKTNNKAKHTWDSGSITTEATATTEGVKTFTCNICGQTKTETIPATGDDSGNEHTHTWDSAWSTNKTSHWKKCTDSTCTEINSIANHDFGDWIIDNYAVIEHDATGIGDTVKTMGNKHRVCNTCGYQEKATHTEEQPLEEHNHQYDNSWVSDETNHWHQCTFGKTVGYGGRDMYACEEKSGIAPHSWNSGVITTQPTYTTEGVKTYTCTVCEATKQESVPMLVDNTDGSEIIQVSFNELQGKQPATVNSNTKAYLDAMKAAESSITEPYKMTDLNNGVNVENYLSKTQEVDSAGQGHNKPQGVKISWSKGSMDYSTATIKYATKSDMSDALEVATSGTEVTLNNLYSNTKYYYQLNYTKGTTLYKSNFGTFETADYIRFIDMGLVYNVRDMGNYKTSYGGRVKQGIIYRGSELTPKAYNDKNGPHPKNIDNDVLALQKNVLKIGVEIDHRDASESQNLTGSPLGSDVEYKRDGYKVSAYKNFLSASSSDIQNIYNAFANADKKHVYFHCIGGADRTGCVAFVLLGILGVSYSDCVSDFEVTTSTNYPRSRYFNNGSAPYYSTFPDFLKSFKQQTWYDGTKSFRLNCEAYLKSKGVTTTTIEKIRSIMIDGYKTGDMPNEGGNTTGDNTGTQEVETTCQHTFGSSTNSTNSSTAYASRICSKCGAKEIAWDVDKYSSDSSTKPNAVPYKIGSNGAEVTYKVTVDKAYTGKLYIIGSVDHYTTTDSANGNCGFFSGKNNGGGSNNSGSSPNLQITVNGTTINITNKKTYVEMGQQKVDKMSVETSAVCEVGSCELKAGENIIKWKRLDSYGLSVFNFKFVENKK